MVWRKVGGRGWRKVVKRWRKKFNGVFVDGGSQLDTELIQVDTS